MREYHPELVLDGLMFPEGPRWHEGRLWFSDQYSKKVIAVDRGGKHETIVEVPGHPSGLGFLANGDVLIVSMNDRKLLKLRGKKLEEVADLSSIASFHCNEMLVDAEGRAYVGNFGF